MIVKLLIQKYGHLANGDPVDGTKLSAWEQEFKRNQEGYEAPAVNSFGCDYDEDDLSKIKSRMVNKKHWLAEWMNLVFRTSYYGEGRYTE